MLIAQEKRPLRSLLLIFTGCAASATPFGSRPIRPAPRLKAAPRPASIEKENSTR
jgi:hypothetical protein